MASIHGASHRIFALSASELLFREAIQGTSFGSHNLASYIPSFQEF